MDWHLTSLDIVIGIRDAMADHIDQTPSTNEQQPLLSVGRNHDVSVLHCHGGADTDRFFTETLHVKREATLSLHLHHTIVISTNSNHVFQSASKRIGIEPGVPGTHSLIFVIQHTKQSIGEFSGIGTSTVNVGFFVMSCWNLMRRWEGCPSLSMRRHRNVQIRVLIFAHNSHQSKVAHSVSLIIDSP